MHGGGRHEACCNGASRQASPAGNETCRGDGSCSPGGSRGRLPPEREMPAPVNVDRCCPRRGTYRTTACVVRGAGKLFYLLRLVEYKPGEKGTLNPALTRSAFCSRSVPISVKWPAMARKRRCPWFTSSRHSCESCSSDTSSSFSTSDMNCSYVVMLYSRAAFSNRSVAASTPRTP